MHSILLLLLAFVPAAFGQAAEWGQCGGINWTGPTTCVSGTYCSEQNEYYSQCLPGTASTTATSTTLSTVTTSSTTKAASTTTSKTTTSTQAASTGWEYLISFGDSYSQTGFLINETTATPGNILGNPPFPGWTTTDGDNWIDFLIATYNKTVVLSYNFAYGGATTDASLVAPYESTVLSLVDQTTEFSTYLVPQPSSAPWTASNAMFAVWMGVNDVGNAWYESNWTSIAEAVVTRYFQEVQITYDAGARKFLFLTVPPIQYTPLVVSEGSTTQDEEGAAVNYFNGLLTTAAGSFKSANSGSTVYVYNTTTPFMTAINDPTAYGSPDATCYNGDGVSCLWFNDYHPGQAIHNLVAEGIAALTGI